MKALVAWMAAAAFLLTAAGTRARDDKASFEVYKDKAGEYRWRLKAGNGKILAVPEDAYKNLADAKGAAENVKSNAGTWKVEFVTDKGKQHRWDMKAKNGRVMARSSEGYATKAGAEKAVEAFRAAAKAAKITEVK